VIGGRCDGPDIAILVLEEGLREDRNHGCHPLFARRRGHRRRQSRLGPGARRRVEAVHQAALAEAQKAGKPILVHIFAAWCPVCRAQKPIIEEFAAEPQYKNLVVFDLDFDTQKDDVRALGARAQSTLIAYKAGKEVSRSVGDTNANSIAEMLESTL
jgi:thioredoxin 1